MNRIIDSLPPSVINNIEPQPKISDFIEKEQLGKGAFGSVFLATHKETNELYAIKEINKKKGIKEYINREVDIMYKVNHKNVVKLYSHFESQNELYFIMEYCSQGNLYTLRQQQRSKCFEDKKISIIICSLVNALMALHSNDPPILHRDIKLENLLISSNGEIKLTDFGWSGFLIENTTRETFCGTKAYMPPEILNNLPQDHNVDIWCLGILLFELVTGKLPFVGDDPTIIKNIQTCKIDWPKDINILIKDLITKILKPDPKQRLQLKEIILHPFIVDNFNKLKQSEKDLINTSQVNEIENYKGVPLYYIINKKLIPKNSKIQIKDTLNNKQAKLSNLRHSIDSSSTNSLKTQSNNDYNNISDVGELRSIISKLKVENTELKRSFDIKSESNITNLFKLKKELDEKYSEVTELKRKINTLKNQISSHILTIDTFRSNINLFSEEIEEKDRIILKLTNENASLNDRLIDCDIYSNNHKESIFDIDKVNEISKLQEDINKKDHMLNIISIENEDLKKQLSYVETSTSNYYNQIIKDYEESLKAKELENSKLNISLKIINSSSQK